MPICSEHMENFLARIGKGRKYIRKFTFKEKFKRMYNNIMARRQGREVFLKKLFITELSPPFHYCIYFHA